MTCGIASRMDAFAIFRQNTSVRANKHGAKGLITSIHCITRKFNTTSQMPQLTRLTLLVITNHCHMKRNGKFGCRYCHPIFNFGVQGVKFTTFAQIT